ncbi:MAG: S1C family serine protease [Desulfosarcinaceae bacterium]|nr:S1C family serine protease [Desulfosarcinaceae bacterium]
MKNTCRFLSVCAVILILSAPVGAQTEFEDLFKTIVKLRSNVPQDARTATSLGTEREGNGILIDAEGHILTIGYLILEADSVEVTLFDGQTTSAVLVGYDHESGFGLVKAKMPLSMKPVELGESSMLGEGDLILAVSYGGKDAVQGARVVSRNEFAGYWEYLLENAIFTAPPISGFGGAALIGSDGRLVGIGSLFTQVTVAGLGAIPCNMFVPIDLLKPILEDLKTIGRTRLPPKPWIGLYAEESHGRVIVIRTAPNGPADKAGVKRTDVIVKVKDQPVKGLADLYRKIWDIGKAGVDVPVTVLHGTQLVEINIKSDDRRRHFRFNRHGRELVQLK